MNVIRGLITGKKILSSKRNMEHLKLRPLWRYTYFINFVLYSYNIPRYMKVISEPQAAPIVLVVPHTRLPHEIVTLLI